MWSGRPTASILRYLWSNNHRWTHMVTYKRKHIRTHVRHSCVHDIHCKIKAFNIWYCLDAVGFGKQIIKCLKEKKFNLCHSWAECVLKVIKSALVEPPLYRQNNSNKQIKAKQQFNHPTSNISDTQWLNIIIMWTDCCCGTFSQNRNWNELTVWYQKAILMLYETDNDCHHDGHYRSREVI